MDRAHARSLRRSTQTPGGMNHAERTCCPRHRGRADRSRRARHDTTPAGSGCGRGCSRRPDPEPALLALVVAPKIDLVDQRPPVAYAGGRLTPRLVPVGGSRGAIDVAVPGWLATKRRSERVSHDSLRSRVGDRALISAGCSSDIDARLPSDDSAGHRRRVSSMGRYSDRFSNSGLASSVEWRRCVEYGSL